MKIKFNEEYLSIKGFESSENQAGQRFVYLLKDDKTRQSLRLTQ